MAVAIGAGGLGAEEPEAAETGAANLATSSPEEITCGTLSEEAGAAAAAPTGVKAVGSEVIGQGGGNVHGAAMLNNICCCHINLVCHYNI